MNSIILNSSIKPPDFHRRGEILRVSWHRNDLVGEVAHLRPRNVAILQQVLQHLGATHVTPTGDGKHKSHNNHKHGDDLGDGDYDLGVGEDYNIAKYLASLKCTVW